MKVLAVIVVVVAWVGFVWWFRRAGASDAEEGVRVGSRIPSFHALDENGHRVEGSSLLGAPLLLKFFRGHW